MTAIFKRELKAYFYSPFGYVFIGVYYLFSGFFFYRNTLMANTNSMSEMFGVLFTVTLFLVPILTMRLMSEDRKNKTDQILLMAPVSSVGIILGKYLSALVVYIIAISGTMLAAVVLALFASPEWPVIIGHFLGLLLLGAALISVGLLVSTCTENQIIAAVGGFSASFFLMMLTAVAASIPNKKIAGVVRYMSFENRYAPFTLGIISLDNVIFFLSITAFFVLLTVCLFEKRRWD